VPDQPYSVLDLVHVVCATLGVDPEITFLPAREEVLHAYPSHDMLKSFFDVGVPTTLEVGLGRMALWARTVGPGALPSPKP